MSRSWTATPLSQQGDPRRAPSGNTSVLSTEQWAAVARRLHLSPRELQLACCVFDDATDAAIAAKLGITENTVHTHFLRLYRKLNIRSRAALVVRVFRVYVVLNSDTRNDARARPLKR
jgi:DNA-binding CsgD family transcriptional regulator